MKDKLKRNWQVVPGGTAYYPVTVQADAANVFSCHAWDTSGAAKAAAIVVIHNAMLAPEMADHDELRNALKSLPSGPWTVQKQKLQYPAQVLSGTGLSPVFTMDFSIDADAVAEYLVDLHKRATAFAQIEHALA